MLLWETGMEDKRDGMEDVGEGNMGWSPLIEGH